MYQHFSFQGTPKFKQIGHFWCENKLSGNPCLLGERRSNQFLMTLHDRDQGDQIGGFFASWATFKSGWRFLKLVESPKKSPKIHLNTATICLQKSFWYIKKYLIFPPIFSFNT
jgi:hypothetical protein